MIWIKLFDLYFLLRYDIYISVILQYLTDLFFNTSCFPGVYFLLNLALSAMEISLINSELHSGMKKNSL